MKFSSKPFLVRNSSIKNRAENDVSARHVFAVLTLKRWAKEKVSKYLTHILYLLKKNEHISERVRQFFLYKMYLAIHTGYRYMCIVVRFGKRKGWLVTEMQRLCYCYKSLLWIWLVLLRQMTFPLRIEFSS